MRGPLEGVDFFKTKAKYSHSNPKYSINELARFFQELGANEILSIKTR